MTSPQTRWRCEGTTSADRGRNKLKEPSCMTKVGTDSRSCVLRLASSRSVELVKEGMARKQASEYVNGNTGWRQRPRVQSNEAMIIPATRRLVILTQLVFSGHLGSLCKFCSSCVRPDRRWYWLWRPIVGIKPIWIEFDRSVNIDTEWK